MLCLWCDDPTFDGKKLCPSCDAANSLPLSHCPKPGHGSTLGPNCASCQIEAEAKARRVAADAPVLEALRKIRADHVRTFHDRRWVGMEFAKAHFGQMLDRAIASLAAG